MSKFKIFGIGISIFVGLIVIVFVLELVGLGFTKFFAPKQANIQREVFENTQSYVHGKIQDLAKYKIEYDKADNEIERKTVKSIINQQFAQFDADKVVDTSLRQFLRKMRGF